MEYSAIFHDMDKRFSYAVDKDLFVIRVQVKKDDMKEVILHYEDKYIPMERKDTRKTVPMKKVAVSQFHDYYEAQIKMHLICLRYFFEFTDTQGEKVYYGNYEFDKECITNRDRMFDCPQNLREEEMFEVPEWAANKVVYQIFPSRFAATEPVDKELWYKAPITPMDDLHGNLRGIIEHMDDILTCGIDSLKIEGRMKSAYYLATVVSSYRHLIDLIYQQGYVSDQQLKDIQFEIAKAENRQTGPGFYQGIPSYQVQLYQDHDETVTQEYVASVLAVDDDSVLLQVKNKFTLDDELEIFGPHILSTDISLTGITDENDLPLVVCNKPMQKVKTCWQGPKEVGAMIRKRRKKI